MAKIPKLPYSERPSSVGRARLPESGVPEALGGLSKLAGAGFQLAHNEEMAEAQDLRAVLEAKQAIVDEVETGRRVGDFEESVVGVSEQLKKTFWDDPAKAPEQLLDAARKMAERAVDDAPNTVVGLDLARKTNARVDAAVREMHNWAQTRQTQKAKGDLSIIVNRATAGAESVASLPALGAYIARKEGELSWVFQTIHGGEAPAKMAEMRAGIARSWALATADRGAEGALTALAALDAPKGPLVDNLDVKARESLRSDAKASLAGAFKAQMLDIVRRGVAQNNDLFQAVMKDPQDAGGALIAARQALETQERVLQAKQPLDVETLAKYGVDVEGASPNEILASVKDRIKYVKALDFTRRQMIGFDAEDDLTAVAELLDSNEKLKKGPKNGKELSEVVRQQARLAETYSNKRLTTGTFSALFKNAALSVQAAMANAEDPRGLNVWMAWRYPEVAGNMKLNELFKQNVKIDKATQTRIRIDYMTQFNEASESGRAVDGNRAREMAVRAFTLGTGEANPGVK